MAAASLRLTDLTKGFNKGQFALDSVTFEVPTNTIFGLLGPNGAGKTTLFSLVAGFLKPTRGTVEVLGINIENVSELRGRLSILPQDALFQANVPVLEQMIFFGQLSGFTRAQATDEAMRALEIVGLADQAKKNARVLSHGMSKRLGIAQAFLGKPEVILLDEPTAGLDPVNAKGIRDLIKTIKQTATGTLIISSHNLPEIEELCSHVAILDHGKLIECSAVSSIVQASKKVRMSYARALTEPEMDTIKSVRGVTAVGKHGSEVENEYMIHFDLEASARKQDEVIAEIVQKLAMNGLVPRSVNEGESLENRFLQVTGKS